MKKITAILSVVVLTVALTAFETKQQKTYTFTLTPEETALVFEGLGELPAKRVDMLRAKIMQEVEKQNQPTKK